MDLVVQAEIQVQVVLQVLVVQAEIQVQVELQVLQELVVQELLDQVVHQV